MPKNHKVKAGDCISSIAFNHGLFWETIWNDPNNSALKAERGDPNILKQGDVVHVPDLKLKEHSGATEQRHRFVRKGTPAKLRLRILEEPKQEDAQRPAPGANATQSAEDITTEDPEDNREVRPDKPRANVPYVLTVDGKTFNGNTDGDGRIECSIPPNAREGMLIIEPGTERESAFPLKLGHLDPLSDVSGIKHRLANLGFDCGDRSDEMTPGAAAALSAFQEKHSLSVTGEADEATRDKLRELHGG